MKILFLVGASGSGKTTVAKKLCENTDKYNFINSYTDRDMRKKDEYGHIFIEAVHMDSIIERSDVVAKTDIEGKRYCSLEHQFVKDKINVYIVDADGINDTIKYFPMAEVMSILIQRQEVEVDCVRVGRDVCVPSRSEVDFCVKNDYKIDSVVGVINVLVGLDTFSKPYKAIQSITDKLEDIERQERYLKDIKQSLYVEMWHNNRQPYLNTIKYVEEKINEDFEFDIKIKPDTEPEIIDGYLNFNIIAEYTDQDIYWGDMHLMVDKMSYYAHEYCKEQGYDELAWRLSVSETYAGE